MSTNLRAVGTIQRRQKPKPCTKKRYRDREAALKALRVLQSRSKRDTVPIRLYFHDRCNGFHLTSREQLEAVEVSR